MAADIDAAARAAADAFEEWSRTPGKERKRILHRVADLIVEHRDEIATVECIDTGQAIRRRRRPRCAAPRTSGLLTTLLQHQMAGRCPINIM